MPARNLNVIFLSLVVSFLCYWFTAHNKYARIISDAMGIVETEHLEKVPRRDLFVAAMDGMLESLDEHSAFFADSDFDRFNQAMTQQFGGIGIQVLFDQKANCVRVEVPFFDSPAFKAGIQSGDRIVAVAGTDTIGMKTDDVVKLIKGPLGQKVKIKVRREGIEDFEVDVERATVNIPSISGYVREKDGTWSYFLDVPDKKIGYIRLEHFGENSAAEFREALKNLGKIDGLVFDLRFNSGGLLPAAVEICDMFIEGGTIVSTRGRDGEIGDQIVATNETVIPMNTQVVVLVNQHSASASEIVAACLQDHDRAVVAGQRTYGKGTVQHVITLEEGKSVMKLTTSSYWRPSGKNIHRFKSSKEEDVWGVSPKQCIRR